MINLCERMLLNRQGLKLAPSWSPLSRTRIQLRHWGWQTFFVYAAFPFINELRCEKTYLLKCAQERLKSAWASCQSDQSRSCSYKETLHRLSKICLVKIWISLHECTGWSESLLGPHVQMYVFWRCSLNKIRHIFRVLDKVISPTQKVLLQVFFLISPWKHEGTHKEHRDSNTKSIVIFLISLLKCMGHVERKSAFEHAQNVQIQISLCKRKV